MDVMFSHDADALLKPDILPSAAAEMAGKNVNGTCILRGQERTHTFAGRLDLPANIIVPPLAAHLQRETEIG